jgi:hypothetical protein
VSALAHELRNLDKLSVTTPGNNTMRELAESNGIKVECLGGWLRSLSQVQTFRDARAFYRCSAPGRHRPGTLLSSATRGKPLEDLES